MEFHSSLEILFSLKVAIYVKFCLAKLTLHEQFKHLGWNQECMIENCVYNKVIDMHRIIPGKKGGKYAINNVAIICPNHHAEVHRLKKKIIKIKEFEFKLN